MTLPLMTNILLTFAFKVVILLTFDPMTENLIKLCLMTFDIMTSVIMPFAIMNFIKMAFVKMTSVKMTFS
jgi:hypothetical protein